MKDWWFKTLVSLIYKMFNVICMNDTVIWFSGHEKREVRIMDFYSDGSFDIIDDNDPSPMRINIAKGSKLKLKRKFFKPIVYSDFRNNEGWRPVFVRERDGKREVIAPK